MRLRAEPGTDPVRALRAALKTLYAASGCAPSPQNRRANDRAAI